MIRAKRKIKRIPIPVIAVNITYSDANGSEEILFAPEVPLIGVLGHKCDAIWDGFKKRWELQFRRILYLEEFDGELAADAALETCRKYYEVANRIGVQSDLDVLRSAFKELLAKEKSEDWWKGMLVY